MNVCYGSDFIGLLGFCLCLVCGLIGRFLLKAAAFVIVVLHWLLLLLFSSWFGWLNFTDEFRICFSGICSPYLSWRYLRVFFLLSCWIVSSWLLLTCYLIFLYSVEGRFDWSFESISFISYSISLIVVSKNFIAIFISCFAKSSWILYHWLTNSSFWFPMEGSRLIFKPFSVNLSRKHFSKNSLCDKNRIFLFLIPSRRNASFFISSSLLVFLPWLFRSGVWKASVLLSSMKLVWYMESTLSVSSTNVSDETFQNVVFSFLEILSERMLDSHFEPKR